MFVHCAGLKPATQQEKNKYIAQAVLRSGSFYCLLCLFIGKALHVVRAIGPPHLRGMETDSGTLYDVILAMSIIGTTGVFSVMWRYPLFHSLFNSLFNSLFQSLTPSLFRSSALSLPHAPPPPLLRSFETQYNTFLCANHDLCKLTAQAYIANQQALAQTALEEEEHAAGYTGAVGRVAPEVELVITAETQIEGAKLMFQRADRNSDGSMNIGEFGEMLDAYGA
jgi:hypothetical protein